MYGASVIADARKLSIGPDDPIKKDEGVKIGFTVRKNHVITDKFPYVKTEYYGIFGVGTEKYLELIQLAVANNIIVKGGAFYKLPDENGDPQIRDGEKMQWQGTAKFRQYCIEHPEFFEELKDRVSGKEVVETLSIEEVDAIKEEEADIEKEVEDILPGEDIIDKANKKKKK